MTNLEKLIKGDRRELVKLIINNHDMYKMIENWYCENVCQCEDKTKCRDRSGWCQRPLLNQSFLYKANCWLDSEFKPEENGESE